MSDIFQEIKTRLQEKEDKKYAGFQQKLIPNIPAGSIIGVRTPELRKLAKEFAKREDIADFLTALPHTCFEENQLHAFLLSLEKDFEKLMPLLETFLPYVDNWATCDQLSPKIFKKSHMELLPYIEKWLSSKHTYTVRFGIGMLMQHFLDDDFDPRYPELVVGAQPHLKNPGEKGTDIPNTSKRDYTFPSYYIDMMIAWYFATALAKQYDAVVPFIEGNRLAPWTHNKAIQKALESYRIPAARKDYLRNLKRKV